ncbi:MAG: hypothetical protein IJW43_04110 [Clostridia bacterium]|nr:hypothetical protein [Clostridia bacterium]
MKLIKCYISSFGKIKDFEINFNEGITTINQENGWGKSTLASFIKAMFYGLNDSRQSIGENERKKFKPWNSTERFGGYLVVEKKGRVYKIERFFGTKEREDSVVVTDVETGKTFNTEDLGKRFFQIDEEGFVSTTYFTQKDFEIKSNASITAKYNETYEIQDTENYEKALKMLDERAKELKSRGDKGEISLTKAKIYQIKEDLIALKNFSTTIEDLKNQEKTLEKEVESLRIEQKLISDKITKAGEKEANKIKRQNYDKLVLERDKLVAENNRILEKLNGEIELAKRVEEYSALLGQLNELSIKLDGLEKDIENLKNLSQKPVEKTQNKSVNLPWLISSIGVGVLGIVFAFINLFVGLSVAVIGIISTIICLIVKPKGKVQEQENTGVLSLIESKEKDLKEYSSIYQKTKSVLDSYLIRFNVESSDYTTALREVKELLVYYQNNLDRLKVLSISIEELKSQKDIFDTDDSVEDLSYLREKLDKVSREFSEKASILADKKARIKSLEVQLEKKNEYEEELVELTELLEESQKEYELLNLTLDYLKKADENLKIKYRAPIENNLNKQLKNIAGEKLSANIDVDFKVTINEPSGAKDINYYSKGYRNLIEICKRFALIEVLFSDDKPFIILDDPFVNLDDEKLKEALELVNNISKEYQILYMICHESRRA